MAAELTILSTTTEATSTRSSPAHNALVVLERTSSTSTWLSSTPAPRRVLRQGFSQGRWGDIYNCAVILAESCEQDE